MVVSPCSSHSFRFHVVWDNIVVIRNSSMQIGQILCCSIIFQFSSSAFLLLIVAPGSLWGDVDEFIEGEQRANTL